MTNEIHSLTSYWLSSEVKFSWIDCVSWKRFKLFQSLNCIFHRSCMNQPFATIFSMKSFQIIHWIPRTRTGKPDKGFCWRGGERYSQYVFICMKGQWLYISCKITRLACLGDCEVLIHTSYTLVITDYLPLSYGSLTNSPFSEIPNYRMR